MEERVVNKPEDIENFNIGENSYDFTKVIFKCEILIVNKQFNQLIFDEAKFEFDIVFKNVGFKKELSFQKARFIQRIGFIKCLIFGNLYFKGAVLILRS